MENRIDSQRRPSTPLVAVSDISSQLAAAIARRLAAGGIRLVLGSAQREDQSLARAEIDRARLLSGQYEPAEYRNVDVSTLEGSNAFTGTLDGIGDVDAIIHAASPARGSSPDERLTPLSSMLDASLTALARRPGSRVFLVLDLSTPSTARLSSSMRVEIEEAFERLIRNASKTRDASGLMVNGMVVGPINGQVDRALMLGGEIGLDGTNGALSEARSAAAGVAEFLLSEAARGITGRIFRVTGPAAESALRTSSPGARRQDVVSRLPSI